MATRTTIVGEREKQRDLQRTRSVDVNWNFESHCKGIIISRYSFAKCSPCRVLSKDMQVCRALSAPQQQRQLSGTGHLEYLKSHVGKAVLAFGGQHRPRCIVADAGKPSRPVEHVLPPAPDLGERKAEQSWNASSLAFLGDSVWEVRGRHVWHCCCCQGSLLSASVLPRCSCMQGGVILARPRTHLGIARQLLIKFGPRLSLRRIKNCSMVRYSQQRRSRCCSGGRMRLERYPKD